MAEPEIPATALNVRETAGRPAGHEFAFIA